MVLMNASKMARCQSSIINRENCGGVKKGGLSPSIGTFLSSNPNLIGSRNTQWVGGKRPVCNPLFAQFPTQKYGYRATLGMM
jgi:hypothetical protein